MAGRRPRIKKKIVRTFTDDHLTKKHSRIPKNETAIQMLERMARERYELQCHSAGVDPRITSMLPRPILHLKEEWHGEPKKPK